MKETIDQFMWGFQQHFRNAVQSEIERCLEMIGLPVEVQVVLVGLAFKDNPRHKICVEPEDGSLTVAHVDAVPSRTLELFKAGPESKILHSDPRARVLRIKRLIMQSRAKAIEEAITTSGTFEGLTIFASESAPIYGYDVHTCVGVPADAWETLPAFDSPIVDRVYVGQSLQHEVIAQCLYRADKALYQPDPGADLSPLGSAEDIIRDAAIRLSSGMMCRATGMPGDLFPIANQFTSLTYERSGANGHLAIVQREKVADRLTVQFEKPISLRNARIMRKLLELSDPSTYVLADYSGAYGLGNCEPVPGVVRISVTGHAEWELKADELPLLRVVSRAAPSWTTGAE